MAGQPSQLILHCQEVWAYEQSIVGNRCTSYREYPTRNGRLVVIAQTSEQNGTDTRSFMMFNEGKESFRLQLRVHMGTIRKPRKESDKATLARVTKEMAQPRIAKSARKDA